MGCFGGGGGTSSESTISKEQREGLQTVLDWATPYLKSTPAGQQYPGELFAPTPDLFSQAYNDFADNQFGSLQNETIRDLMSGRPAYEFDPVKTTARWKETFAEPVMETWRETVAPVLQETMNMPGTFYGRGTSDYLSQQAGEFFGGKVAPTLYDSLNRGELMGAQSAENAFARRSGALSLPFMQFTQQAGAAQSFQQQQQAPLSMAYQEYLRQDPFRYAQLLGGVSTVSTMENIAQQGTASPLASIGGAMAGGWAGSASGSAALTGLMSGI